MKRRVILVSGVGRSGKTSSIRRYLELEEVFHLREKRDIFIVFPLRRRGITVGVATGGDTLRIVTGNFRFFNEHDWSVVVCASKSYGATRNFVIAEARRLNATLIELSTRKVTRSLKQEHDRMARQIRKRV